MVRRWSVIRTASPPCETSAPYRGSSYYLLVRCVPGHGASSSISTFEFIPVYLGHIEHAIATGEQQARAGQRFAVLPLLGIVCELPKHNCGGLLTLPYLCFPFLPLLVRGPLRRLVTLGLRRAPQTQRVDATVGLPAGYVDGAEGKASADVPRHFPIADTLLDCVDDCVRTLRYTSRWLVEVLSEVDIVKLTFSRCLGDRAS